MRLIFVLIAISPLALAHAAGDDDLWEVTNRVTSPNKANLGAKTHLVCREKGKFVDAWTNGGKCETTDVKEYQNSFTRTFRCPNGGGEIDMFFNKERTAYTGTARLTSAKGNTLTLDVIGKRIGTCDVQQENSKANPQRH